MTFCKASTCAFKSSTSTEQLRYRVHHSVFGNIGTYTNMVQTAGDVTMVRTSVHFLVTMLGVALHREDADRTSAGAKIHSSTGNRASPNMATNAAAAPPVTRPEWQWFRD